MRPSWLFLLLVAVTGASGAALALGVGPAPVLAFLFVIAGWLVSLCLHEFAHAFVAYRYGDTSVVYRGYLTLDPLKYTHVVYSLVLPLVFVLIGGIGLPGGAVFIDRSALRTRFAHSAVSAAGPLTNIAIGALLATAVAFAPRGYSEFWAAVAYLTFLQITAAILNLLPVPGLDGFGILEPYLGRRALRFAATYGQYAVFALFLLLLIPPVNAAFFGAVFGLLQLLGVPPLLVSLGDQLFRFWL